jgi:hypothetical protein
VRHHRHQPLLARARPGRQLELLDTAGVDGGLVFTFTAPGWPGDDDPEQDLDTDTDTDTDTDSLVKSRPGRGHGTVYPDMPGEPEAGRAGHPS